MNNKIKNLLFLNFLFLFNFSCVAGWDLPATDLSDNSENAVQSQVAMDEAGNAIAVWIRSNGSNWIVQADRYNVVTSSWMSTPTNLSEPGEDAIEPQIAMDAAGNAIAVWSRDNGSNAIVQADRYNVDTDSWMSTATNLSVPGEDARVSQISMDVAGNAIAVWQRLDGFNWIVQADRYDVVTNSWMPTATNLSVAGENAEYPQVAMDSEGNAIAVWQRYDGSNTIIQTKRYDKVTGWSSPAIDLSVSGENATYPKVAVDGEGNAIAIWRRYDGSNWFIQAKRYNKAMDLWSSPADDIYLVAEGDDGHQVAMDGAGNAFVIWQRFNGISPIVQVRRYDVATGLWLNEVIDLSVPGQYSITPQISMDNLGDAIAVWSGFDGSNFIIQSKTYIQGSWESEVTDLSEIGKYVYNPQVAMSSLEKSVAVWYRKDNETDERVVQAVLGNFVSIENLTASKNCYRFPTQLDLTHCLKWDATSGAAEYRIYLDAELTDLVAIVVASDSPCSEVHNRCPGVQVTYYVVSVDSAGVFGVPSSVTI